MKSTLLKKLNNSYYKVRRDRHLLYPKFCMDDAECRLWELFVSVYGWDKKHVETYGIVHATHANLAEVLGSDWSISKVSRTKDKLIEKGIIVQLEKSIYKIVGSPLLEDPLAVLQKEFAPTQGIFASVQTPPGKTNDSGIVSYKDEYNNMTVGDENWISQNLNRNIKNE